MQSAAKVRVIASNFEEISPYLKRHCPSDWNFSDFFDDSGKSEFSTQGFSEPYLIAFGSVVDQTVLQSFSELRFIQLLSAGTDSVDLKRVREMDVRIADNNGTNSSTVADHTLCLILSLLRGIRHAHDNVVSGRWQKERMSIMHLSELGGKTVGIIGLGRIGSQVASRLRGFGAHVVFYDIAEITLGSLSGYARRVSSPEELFSCADIVSLHVPLTDLTRQIINRESLALFKTGAVLVNTSRGSLVDSDALIAALASKKLSGAALDVFHGEPEVPPGLLDLESVILSPHRAGSSRESWDARISFAFQNILRVHTGEEPISEI